MSLMDGDTYVSQMKSTRLDMPQSCRRITTAISPYVSGISCKVWSKNIASTSVTSTMIGGVLVHIPSSLVISLDLSVLLSVPSTCDRDKVTGTKGYVNTLAKSISSCVLMHSSRPNRSRVPWSSISFSSFPECWTWLLPLWSFSLFYDVWVCQSDFRH